MILKRPTKGGDPRYAVRVRVGTNATGGPEFLFKTFATRGEAEVWERGQRHDLDTGSFCEPSQEPFGEYLREWLAGPVALMVRPRTLAGYTKLLDCYVQKALLAKAPLGKVTTLGIDRLYADLTSRRIGGRTVRIVHTLVKAALAKAERDRLIVRNPAIGATLPRQVKHKMQALDAAQMAKLLAKAEELNSRHRVLWQVLGYGGLRPSEGLALRWQDVLLDGVWVRGSLARVDGSWKVTETKTGKERRVPLPPVTMEALAWHRTQQEAEKLAEGSRYVDHGFVFAAHQGQPLDLGNVVLRFFKPLLKAAGLPNIRLYDLRHSFASNALVAGLSVLMVAELLGNSADMVWKVYGHVLSKERAAAGAQLAAYFAAEAGARSALVE
jgi:integrase